MQKLKTWCIRLLAQCPTSLSDTLICSYFMILQSAVFVPSRCSLLQEVMIQRKLFCANVAGLTPCEVVRSCHSSKVNLIICSSKRERLYEIPYSHYPSYTLLMTHPSNNKINRQQTIRFSSVPLMVIHSLDVYLAACLHLSCSQGSGGI